MKCLSYKEICDIKVFKTCNELLCMLRSHIIVSFKGSNVLCIVSYTAHEQYKRSRVVIFLLEIFCDKNALTQL